MYRSDLTEENFTFQSPDRADIFVRKWNMESLHDKKGIIQIAHGMMEHSYRYRYFAEALAKAGYLVFANDHRGHGFTARNSADIGSICENGFDRMVLDMHQLSEIIKGQYPSLPLFLFGHSMGSFLVHKYIGTYGREIEGAILSGSNGKVGSMIHIGIWLARLEMKKKGTNWRSRRLHNLVFGSYNKQISFASSEYAWLSRDENEVNAYIADPLCGQLCTSQFYCEFFVFLKNLHLAKYVSTIPIELPVFIFSGDRDPVGKSGKGIRQLVHMYEKAGLSHVKVKLYPNGRHEMLHEINRDEVIQDVISWLQRRQTE